MIPPEFADGSWLPEETVSQYLRSAGKGVKIYRGCRIVPPSRVDVGDHSQIDESVRVFAGQGVTIARYVHLASGVVIAGGGTCFIGDFAGLGASVRLVTGTEVVDEGGLTNSTIPIELRSVRRSFVRVEPYALIFTGSIVLPGVTIGEGAVVAAGSVVHRDLKPWGIYAGSPLVQIGVREREPVLEKGALLAAGRV